MIALVVTPLEHRAVVVAASVEGHREMLLECAHELRGVPHPTDERLAVFAEARDVSLRRTDVLKKILLLDLQPLPLTEHLRKRGIAIEDVDAPQDLVIIDLLSLGNIDENVKMVRHDRIRENDHAGELLYSAQQLHRPRLLLVIEEERPVCQSADQMIAPTILNHSGFPHAEQYIKDSLLYHSGMSYCIDNL